MMVGPVSIAPPRGVRGLWDSLSRNQRLALGGVAALALAMVVAFASMARSPEYGVAFANLPETEAAALVAKLKEAKIPYELAERGTIKVPSNQVQETRLLAAAAGI